MTGVDLDANQTTEDVVSLVTETLDAPALKRRGSARHKRRKSVLLGLDLSNSDNDNDDDRSYSENRRGKIHSIK